ncbi:hypothetical protein R1flu_013108 [Riccia fluitans]|uniref:Uncharacterized protein n=1 Tax=Riccia fluitans TaxID=41844 RepID=A0ABD1ZCN4_9MARC
MDNLSGRRNKPALNPNSEFCLMEPDLGNSHEHARTGSQEQLVEFQIPYPKRSLALSVEFVGSGNVFLVIPRRRGGQLEERRSHGAGSAKSKFSKLALNLNSEFASWSQTLGTHMSKPGPDIRNSLWNFKW